MKSLNTKIALAALLLAIAGGSLKAETFNVDTKTSEVAWVGKKVTGQHNGTVGLKSGSFDVEKGVVKGGKFTVDMTSIKVLDLQGDSNGKLTGHLKSDDFFSVDKHPTAEFKITSIEQSLGKPMKDTDPNYTVTGDLTIKGMSHPLTFPANIKVTSTGLTAIAKEVKVDRTLYDIRYGSGKFFQGLGDKVIYDEFLLDLKLNAKK